VLPFADLSQSGDQEYFCDGIAEEITSALATVESLNVAARSSSFRFKGRDSDIREVGEVLNVDLVLEGSVRSAGNRLRITAQLVSVGDGYHIWSERYDRSMEDIFEVQDEISEAIVKALKVKIDESEHPQLMRRGTSDVDAYHYYLRGRHCWNRRHQGVLPKAIEYFHKAIDADPGYALAYVGLADAYNVLGYYGFEPPERSFARARSAAEKALQINPEQAEAYNSLGYTNQHHDWDWTEAEKNYQKALELRPEYAVANQWYGIFLSCRARHEEAIARVTRARELDPLSPVINTAVGWLHYHAGDYQHALSELLGALDLDPVFPWLRYVLGQVHDALDQGNEARGHFQSAVETTREAPFYLAGLGYCLARMGDEDGAREVVQRLDQIGATGYVAGVDMALVHAGLQDADNTFAWLTKALNQRAVGLTYLGVDPRFDFVRGDKRLKALVRQLDQDFG
jgi:TolB-like protein/Tfp pilus assembly protein PilF